MLHRRIFPIALSSFAFAAGLSGCGDGRQSGPVQVGVIGGTLQLSEPANAPATAAAQLLYAATAQGLVAYDASGEVVPGLAQRWIVVDDGRSYIFRLRRAQWGNGAKVDARDVRRLFAGVIAQEKRRDPYGPVAGISEILAMTADVIEIRLKSPQPDFLLALAQPEMGIALPKGGGTGPFRLSTTPDGSKRSDIVVLEPVGLTDPARPEERQMIRAERASKAILRFNQLGSDLLLGGTLADLPYIALADTATRNVRFDPVQGVFGLALSQTNPMFDDAHVREALSMAIDRQAIVSYFDINRWKIAEQMVPQQFNLPHPPSVPSWAKMSVTERRSYASGVITRWQSQHKSKPVELSISMPKGPGMQLLFLALQVQLRAIGVDVTQVTRNGDLTLIDEVAPYDSAAWYLGRLSCARKVHCSQEAEKYLKQSVEADTMKDRAELLGQAEIAMQKHDGFIPLAAPVRWSLVSGRMNGFQSSARGDRSLRRLIR